MTQNNAFTLESSGGEVICFIGCDDDCDCTSLLVTKQRRGKTKRFEITLPRQALEMLRDGIDSILEFHDSKSLD